MHSLQAHTVQAGQDTPVSHVSISFGIKKSEDSALSEIMILQLYLFSLSEAK